MKKRYSSVSGGSDNMSHSDMVSVASSQRRFTGKKLINSELSEPLTFNDEESFGGGTNDPYFVFRSDLQDQLELVDESLAEYLRTVHEIVRTVVVMFSVVVTQAIACSKDYLAY